MSNILMCGTNPIGQVSDMTASNISYSNTSSGLTATDVQAAIDELNTNKLSMGGGTLNGDLTIDEPSSTTGRGQSTIIIGNNTAQGTVGNSQGCIRIFGINTGYTQIWDDRNSTNNINVVLPSQTGTIALTSDLQWVLAYQNLTFDSDLVDVSAYSELYVVPKLQGYARSYPTFMLRLPSFDIATAGVEFSGSSITNGIMYGINIDSSNRLKLRGTLTGWTTVTFDIYGR